MYLVEPSRKSEIIWSCPNNVLLLKMYRMVFTSGIGFAIKSWQQIQFNGLQGLDYGTRSEIVLIARVKGDGVMKHQSALCRGAIKFCDVLC